MIGAEVRGRWLRTFRRAERSDLRLVCFPHAGGNANVFQPWAGLLDGATDLLAVCYPGRQDRLLEPCVDQMDVLAERISDVLVPYLDRPIAFFGHSLGASVAYEVTLVLESRYGFTPSVLFVSGHGAPHVCQVDLDPDLADDEYLLGRIGALGEVDPVLLRSPKLRELIMPSLRGTCGCSTATCRGNRRRSEPRSSPTWAPRTRPAPRRRCGPGGVDYRLLRVGDVPR